MANVPSDASRYAMTWDGEWHVTYEVFLDLGIAFAAVLILIYGLVVGWFVSFLTPLIIMAAIPFSLIGTIPAHGLLNAFFTATSMIGFIAGAGIVVRNSIILVDFIGVSRQGHIVQSVRDRSRPKDSGFVAGEEPWRESKTAEPSDNILGKECAQRTRLQRTVNADVASLHEIPVAETVDNARKQQELTETSPKRQFSPAGYQRRHGVKDDVETGETLGARRRNPVEEMPAITASGKCWHRHQGGGSGRSTDDGRAAKRARREGPGPVSIPSGKVRQG